MLPRILIFSFALSVVFFPQQSHAEDFSYTKNNIISNTQLTDADYLSEKGVNQFLNSYNSVLYNYKTESKSGSKLVRVSQIITNVAEKYTLNPMLFLVMAQKESSAVTATDMTEPIRDWILGFGRCDGCSKEQAAPYKGIARQFHSAADQIRNGYLTDLEEEGETISGWAVGETKKTIDGINVTPENEATAALYTYNPCVGAYGGGYSQYGCNSLFQKLWKEWNPEPEEIATVRYPNGTIIQVNAKQYLIEKGEKREIDSRIAEETAHNAQSPISVPVVVAEQYKTGEPVVIPNDSLVQAPNGTVYYVKDDKKHGVASREALVMLRFKQEAILFVDWEQLNDIPDGPRITVHNAGALAGTLAQNIQTGGVYWINEENEAQAIWSKTVLDNQFSDREILNARPKDINKKEQAEPVGLADGTVVKSPHGVAVYVITNRKKRPFASQEAMDYYGYDWNDVITVEDVVLDIHKTGKPMEVPEFEQESLR